MKPRVATLAVTLLISQAVVRAAELTPFTPDADVRGSWAMTVDSNLPNVLILGDSISIGYTRAVRQILHGEANVFRPMKAGGKQPENCGDTGIGLKNLDRWLGTNHWDVIHFNWGLWDLCYRNPKSKTQGQRDKVSGTITFSPEEYAHNLEQLVARLQATGARLIWASTTVVPADEAGRFVGDDVKYNAVAARVMKAHGIPTDDLHALTKSFGGEIFAGKGNVHFKPEGYERIAKQVANEIRAALPPAKIKPSSSRPPESDADH